MWRRLTRFREWVIELLDTWHRVEPMSGRSIACLNTGSAGTYDITAVVTLRRSAHLLLPLTFSPHRMILHTQH